MALRFALRFAVIAVWKNMALYSKPSMITRCTDQAQQILLRPEFASIAIEGAALIAVARLISNLM